MDADFLIDNHGSIVLVTPVTDAAKAWVAENVPLESWQWFGGAFACEPRYVGSLIEGAASDGLTAVEN